MRAVWNGQVIAESDATVDFDNNHYFPPNALKDGFFQPSETTSLCPWKGTASYLSVTVDGETNADAVWTYPDPLAAASAIKGHFAFWKGVSVEP